MEELPQLVPAIAGWIGALLTTGGYALVSRGAISPASRWFQLTNAVGALLLAFSAATAGAWPSVVSSAVWVLIGVAAMVASWRRARTLREGLSRVRRTTAPVVPRPTRPRAVR